MDALDRALLDGLVHTFLQIISGILIDNVGQAVVSQLKYLGTDSLTDTITYALIMDYNWLQGNYLLSGVCVVRP